MLPLCPAQGTPRSAGTHPRLLLTVPVAFGVPPSQVLRFNVRTLYRGRMTPVREGPAADTPERVGFPSRLAGAGFPCGTAGASRMPPGNNWGSWDRTSQPRGAVPMQEEPIRTF